MTWLGTHQLFHQSVTLKSDVSKWLKQCFIQYKPDVFSWSPCCADSNSPLVTSLKFWVPRRPGSSRCGLGSGPSSPFQNGGSLLRRFKPCRKSGVISGMWWRGHGWAWGCGGVGAMLVALPSSLLAQNGRGIKGQCGVLGWVAVGSQVVCVLNPAPHLPYAQTVSYNLAKNSFL